METKNRATCKRERILDSHSSDDTNTKTPNESSCCFVTAGYGNKQLFANKFNISTTIMFKGDISHAHFQVHIVLCVSTRTCLHALMFKKTHYSSHSVCLNIPVFTLCLKRSVLTPVSLRPPPEKAQFALIGS